MAEYEIRSGATTRIVTLTTGERVSFTREALEDAAEQVEHIFVPMTTEHLTYLPPLGRIYGAEVVEDEEGERDLVYFARDLPRGLAGDLRLATTHPDDEADHDGPDLKVQVGIEPRNFDREVWEDIRRQAPCPVAEQTAWSELPPIVWMISVPVVWGATQFAGAFLKRLGEATAEGLVEWITNATKRAKDSQRDALVEVRFKVPKGPVIFGVCPLDAGDDASVVSLEMALNASAALANFAGEVIEGRQPPELRRAAFCWDGLEWRLGWWATNEAVFVTPWFVDNCPDPKRFLGRPLLGPDENGPRGDLNEPQ
jgi:hypothetical protein